jgi:hypothetical protein
METAQAAAEKLDFDKVWAAIQATNEQLKETDRIVKENAIQMKETDKRVGEITNRFGEMVELNIWSCRTWLRNSENCNSNLKKPTVTR